MAITSQKDFNKKVRKKLAELLQEKRMSQMIMPGVVRRALFSGALSRHPVPDLEYGTVGEDYYKIDFMSEFSYLENEMITRYRLVIVDKFGKFMEPNPVVKTKAECHLMLTLMGNWKKL